MASVDVFSDAVDSNVERERRDSFRVNEAKRRKPGSNGEELTEMQSLREEMQELKTGLSKVLSEVVKVGQKFDSFEERFSVVEGKLKSQSDEMREVRKGMGVFEEKVRFLEERVIDQEARSRRNNLIFHGVEESANEPYDCTQLAIAIVRDKCKVTEKVSIERAHRLGGKRHNTNGASQAPLRPRPIIVRFHDFNQKERVREGRRHLPASIHLTEDLPFPIRQAQKQLVPEMQAAKQARKRAWISYPARLIIEGREVRSIRPTMNFVNRNSSGSQDTRLTPT